MRRSIAVDCILFIFNPLRSDSFIRCTSVKSYLGVIRSEVVAEGIKLSSLSTERKTNDYKG